VINTNRAIPAADIRLLIFDLDGTLVDSRLDLTNSINAMLRQFRKPELPCDVIASYIGDGAPMLVRRALGDPDEEAVVQEALNYFLAYYREHKLDNTRVYDGVLDMATLGGAQQQAGWPFPRHRRCLGDAPLLLRGIWRKQLPYQEA
jgi:phosphoglycolate phosphatase